MKVNIIYEPGWILEKFAKQLAKRLPYVVLQEPLKKHKINYYLPYYLLEKGPWKSVGWFTHQEERPDLNKKFEWAAKNADFCISHSKKYAELIRSWNIKKVSQITPGIYLDKYCPKVKLGFVGRIYSSTNRKNSELLNRVNKMPIVDLVSTDGKLAAKDLPAFYRSLDAVFVSSTIEGGPMCLIEGLACGVPVIAPAGVGAVDEYEGVMKYKKGDFESARQVIRKIYARKTKLRSAVLDHTWERFAKEHDKIFRRFM